jgi:hypothetical protein
LIADQVTRIGKGQAQATVAVPERGFSDLAAGPSQSLQEGDSAGAVACGRGIPQARLLAVRRNVPEPQPGIRKSNPRSIEAGVKVLRHSVQINGYAAPERHELIGKDGSPGAISSPRK